MSQYNMTEEEIKALQDAKEAADKKAEEAEAARVAAEAEAAKAKTDLTGVVDELKSERQKKAEALKQAEIINKDEPTDINTAIEQALQEKEAARRKAELEQAINDFKSSKTEFSNDETGLVFEKFKQSLSNFNLGGISSREQAKEALERAYQFNKFSSGEKQPDEPGYEGTPSGVPSAPGNVNPADTNNEKLAEASRVPVDKVKELQDKYADAFVGLGIQ